MDRRHHGRQHDRGDGEIGERRKARSPSVFPTCTARFAFTRFSTPATNERSKIAPSVTG
jgi:hypothetical protein